MVDAYLTTEDWNYLESFQIKERGGVTYFRELGLNLIADDTKVKLNELRKPRPEAPEMVCQIPKITLSLPPVVYDFLHALLLPNFWGLLEWVTCKSGVRFDREHPRPIAKEPEEPAIGETFKIELGSFEPEEAITLDFEDDLGFISGFADVEGKITFTFQIPDKGVGIKKIVARGSKGSYLETLIRVK